MYIHTYVCTSQPEKPDIKLSVVSVTAEPHSSGDLLSDGGVAETEPAVSVLSGCWEQFDIKGLKSTDLFVVLRLPDRT